MNIRTIEWEGKGIRIIDQTLLPGKLEYLRINDLKTFWRAIRELKVRGAPALGAAGALGVYLGVKDSKAKSRASFDGELSKTASYIASSRPTAVNLSWGVRRMEDCLRKNPGLPVREIKKALLKEARAIIDEDKASCGAIGKYGRQLIKDGDSVLTVCNAGALATLGIGTALGVLYSAREQGKKFKVYSCETRPLLQGARLTTWELSRGGIDVTLICDNMAATLMKQGKVDKVIAGADRIAANGDAANKIGTYNLAVLAKYHRVPFYIAAPLSTFDLKLKSGREIPIEERPAGEITELHFHRRMAADRVKVYNPAFDVTDAGLITAIITDKGVLKPPYNRSIRGIIGASGRR